MNCYSNMNFKTINKGSWKEKLLKKRLKKLELEKAKEITRWLSYCPEQAAMADNVQELFRSESIDELDFKIAAINRLLENTTQN